MGITGFLFGIVSLLGIILGIAMDIVLVRFGAAWPPVSRYFNLGSGVICIILSVIGRISAVTKGQSIILPTIGSILGICGTVIAVIWIVYRRVVFGYFETT
ncbi:hypothetical protein AGMMS49579_17300 [Spirochaetia bacterium]|nr:hypothetical protein AGMMS49579_17300 [Spirochaetia bacterium]